jgi:hypothetical protein
MTRVRRLQRKDERGKWYTDAYAIERADGHVILRYPLSWEHLGARYNAEIRQRQLTLEQLEALWSGRNLKWLAIEPLPLLYDEAVHELDRECHIPTTRKAVTVPA